MHIALVQSDLFWNDPIANKNRFDTLLTSVRSTDIIVLPEMFTTAFCLEGSAESMNGASVQWMLQKAKSLNSAVCGSLIIQEDNQRYNRFVWVTPNGDIEYYDKRHLFSLMGEGSSLQLGYIVSLFIIKDGKFVRKSVMIYVFLFLAGMI